MGIGKKFHVLLKLNQFFLKFIYFSKIKVKLCLIKLVSYLLAGICFASSPLVFAEVREYQLVIDEAVVSPTGKPVKRITVNGQFPAPLLEFEEGDEAIIRVKNNLKNQDSSIHWHGLLLPGIMDGVPGF